MASEEYLCQNYLFLKPKEATLFDLIRLLYSSNLEEIRFVEFSDQSDRHIDNFRRRWLIFISVVAQKLLLFIRIPLAIVGNVLELCLNLLSSNGGFLRLLYNLFTGYLESFSTEALLLQDTRADPSVIVVAFRGTSPFQAIDWCTDIDISWYELQNVGKIHGGFMKALGLQPNQSWPKEIDDQGSPPFAYYTIRKILREMLQKNKDAKFIVTGHSLGGALAILFVFVLVLHEEASLLERLEGVYTFGQPRVGDSIFGEFMNKNLKKYEVNYLRFVYSNDIVPRLPYDDKTQMFKHFGDCLYFNSCYKGKVLVEEPNKNYFNLLWIVPKYLNAVWELIRSFIIPYTAGPDYRESWFMRFARVIGLVIPGLPPHGPQDYNNVTRLGSITYSAA
ncbi:hypothetical protein LWI29_029298 [Acer saccharum]|uniref:Fungal lipase-type domain-containing protein n=1 Tax=Acer saccharum TaxID=4024 RepID=A0AA39RN55_ACESA|nr:hypothetical protein LWI29_029298 [Acer saccharum]